MKVLIVAPDLNPPWSEGRKMFIRDLLPELTKQCHLSVLSTRIDPSSQWGSPVPAVHLPCRYKAVQLLILEWALGRHLAKSDRPDVILHFPFGTFSGTRGIANRYSIAAIDRIARKAGVPCLTILYSMTNGSLERLSRNLTCLVAGEGRNWNGPTLNIGINTSNFPVVWSGQHSKKLLFMAGYSENKSSLLQAILHERGLMQLVRIGSKLAESGFVLSIAIPLLRFTERKDELRAILDRHAPNLQVEFIPDASPLELFATHGMYLFPFSASYTRFMPTSVLEAMACGIPVIASRLPMLEAIVRPDDAYCLGFAQDNDDQLFECVLAAHQNWDRTMTRAGNAAKMIRTHWTIDAAARQLFGIARAAMEKSNHQGAAHVRN